MHVEASLRFPGSPIRELGIDAGKWSPPYKLGERMPPRFAPAHIGHETALPRSSSLERQQPEVVIEIDRMPRPFSKRISHTLDLG